MTYEPSHTNQSPTNQSYQPWDINQSHTNQSHTNHHIPTITYQPITYQPATYQPSTYQPSHTNHHISTNHIPTNHISTNHTSRSSSEKLLKIPKCSLTSVGKHSFSFLAPSVELAACQSVESVHPLWLQRSAQTFSFSTGLSSNVGGPFFVCIDYVYACACICMNIVCWYTEFTEKPVLYKSHPLLL